MRAKLYTAALLALIATTGALSAQELPKRKPGLWQIQNTMRGVPSMTGPIEMCVDEKSDDIMKQSMGDAAQNCEKTNWKIDDDKIAVKSVCKFSGSTATTEGTFTGDFGANYRADIHIVYAPPLHGLSSADMTIAAKWLGPCKSGQKAGDITLPNMGSMGLPGGKAPNMEELKKMREQMEKMRGR